jgi:polyhydroxybutyrate depolymerase
MRWLGGGCIGSLIFVFSAAGCSSSTSNAASSDAGATDARGADDAGQTSTGGGCANDAPTLPVDGTRTVQFGGGQRSYLVHVPASYAAHKAAPMLVGLHGDTPSSFGDAAEFFRGKMTGLVAKSDAAGFLLVTPEGMTDDAKVGATWNAGSCCAGDKTRDDVGFIKAVVQAVESEFCVDPKRVYAAGYSSGAFMAYRLACEAADTFAAIAPAAGVTRIATCTPSRNVSIIDFAGTADTEVSYSGGTDDVTSNMTAWVGRDGCGAQSTQTFANGDSHCDTYGGCSQGGAVTLCTVQDGGHAWPGGLDVSSYGLGKTTTDLIANDALWDFFVAHPMP